MDTGNNKITEEWFLVFSNSRGTNTLTPFLQDGFKHVYAMKKTDAGLMWIVVDCVASHLIVKLETVDKYPHPRVYAGEDAVILPVKARITPQSIRMTFGFISCVEIVKAVIGLKAGYIWTPYQLYKYLTR